MMNRQPFRPNHFLTTPKKMAINASAMLKFVAVLACSLTVPVIAYSSQVTISPASSTSSLGTLQSSVPQKLVSVTTRTKALPPFSADILWKKIVELISRHGGYMTSDELANEFDARFLIRNYVAKGDFDGGLTGENDWLRTVFYRSTTDQHGFGYKVIISNGVVSTLTLNMPRDPRDRSNCMNPIEAITDLQRLGWTRTSMTSPDPMVANPNEAQFSNEKSGSFIDLAYGDARPSLERADPETACIWLLIIRGRSS